MAARRVCRFPGLLLGLAVVLFQILPLPAHAASEEGGLTGTVEAYRVVETKDGTELFVSAKEAHPKDIIEYRLMYKNSSNSPLKNIAITDPVPLGTAYISLSATKPDAGEVLFSIDGGKNFHPWPVKIRTQTAEGEEVWKDADPEMVTHIQWTIENSLEPEREVVISYRATVK